MTNLNFAILLYLHVWSKQEMSGELVEIDIHENDTHVDGWEPTDCIPVDFVIVEKDDTQQQTL